VITPSVYLNIKSPTIYTVRDINKDTLPYVQPLYTHDKSVGST
jgi:hypothetical protein